MPLGAQPEEKTDDHQKTDRQVAEQVSCVLGGDRRAGHQLDPRHRRGGYCAAQRYGRQPDGRNLTVRRGQCPTSDSHLFFSSPDENDQNVRSMMRRKMVPAAVCHAEE